MQNCLNCVLVDLERNTVRVAVAVSHQYKIENVAGSAVTEYRHQLITSISIRPATHSAPVRQLQFQ